MPTVARSIVFRLLQRPLCIVTPCFPFSTTLHGTSATLMPLLLHIVPGSQTHGKPCVHMPVARLIRIIWTLCYLTGSRRTTVRTLLACNKLRLPMIRIICSISHRVFLLCYDRKKNRRTFYMVTEVAIFTAIPGKEEQL